MKSMKPHERRWFIIFMGFMFAFGNTLVLMITFITAYFNPGYMTRVYINKFGEAHWELVLMIFQFIIILIGLSLLWKFIRSLRKSEQGT